jgi:hypothetical protein
MLGSVGIWLGIGLLFGFNIWSSHHVMGTIPGWQVWYTEQSIIVGLGVIAACNLYLQGGMKLRHVAWLSLGLAFYDVLFAAYYPLTGRLLARYITHPLTPVLGMRFGEVDYAVGLGDLLVYSLFFVAAYKAYGARAVRARRLCRLSVDETALWPGAHDGGLPGQPGRRGRRTAGGAGPGARACVYLSTAATGGLGPWKPLACCAGLAVRSFLRGPRGGRVRR